MSDHLELVSEVVSSDFYNNICILCMSKDYPLVNFYEEQGMYAFAFRSDENWCYLSHNANTEFLCNYLLQQSGSQFLVISNPEVVKWVKEKHKVIWEITCLRLFREGNFNIISDISILPITSRQLPWVYHNSGYQQFLSMDYLETRLRLGGGFYIENNGVPVAWVMSHDDGSVGMLHVMNEFRRKGLGRMLVDAMSAKVKEKNMPVFAHIEPSNLPSLKLFRSMGFVDKAVVTWMKVRPKLK